MKPEQTKHFKANFSRLFFCGSLFLLIFVFKASTMAGADKKQQTNPEISAGAEFDAAVFGFPVDSNDGKSYGVRWAKSRKIRKVVIEFEDEKNIPKPSELKLQYWRHIWNGAAEPIKAERGAGGAGWEGMDDWSHGKFKDAVVNLDVQKNVYIYTFDSTAKEFEKLTSGVKYRKTLWIQISSDKSFAKPKMIRTYTDSFYKPLTVRIQFGPAANNEFNAGKAESCSLEAFNGYVTAVRSLQTGGVEINPDMKLMIPAGAKGAVEADILMAVDPLSSYKYDSTIITVRSDTRPFSFSSDEVAEGERILVDDLGMLVTRSDDPIALEDYRYQLKNEFSGRTVYDRVTEHKEQTFPQAWGDMPLKHQLRFFHGLPGDRNSMCQHPNADIEIYARTKWFDVQPSDRDTKRKLWKSPGPTIRFGVPSVRAERSLKDGYLPELTSIWHDGPIYYELTSIMDALDRDLSDIALDDPTVLMVKCRFINLSESEPCTAHLFFQSLNKGKGPEDIILEGGKIVARTEDGNRFRLLIEAADAADFRKDEKGIAWSKKLEPGQSCTFLISIPSITLTEADEINALRGRDFQADSKRVCDFWENITSQGTKINTPEEWINDFYKAHLRHMFVNNFKELGSDRLHAHVSTHGYGVYPDESCMMISDLDRRGYPDVARRCLDSFLYYQGTVKMPGNFKTKKGVFYGSGGHDTGGYNKSHGWVMWNMAEHWKFTRDRDWMEKAAPKLIEACEWVIRERSATMQLNPDGTKPIYYGWLPTGSLEDVTDYWYWMVTNVCTVWGFESLANALADFGHPEAARLQKEADAYRDDFMRSMEEARIITPVVKLRDATFVPKYPSRLYERGRSLGWLRETLEGSIHMIITEVLDPKSYKAEWILKDFEDNLYISDIYGYAIPSFDSFWFSRGGFSMQANLLGGPLPYLYRDQIKHYVRAYFNSFASAFDPEVRMCNEHSLPELGYPAGGHFKSSDEAQSTYWLRLMFVNERGNDLYLGQAIPRYWLGNGKSCSIERAASHFGPLSFSLESNAANGQIKAVVEPPKRNQPDKIYVRIRHPEEKPIKSVMVNNVPYEDFNAEKEWIILPGESGSRQEIVINY